jgi:hypothetical protein
MAFDFAILIDPHDLEAQRACLNGSCDLALPRLSGA